MVLEHPSKKLLLSFWLWSSFMIQSHYSRQTWFHAIRIDVNFLKLWGDWQLWGDWCFQLQTPPHPPYISTPFVWLKWIILCNKLQGEHFPLSPPLQHRWVPHHALFFFKLLWKNFCQFFGVQLNTWTGSSLIWKQDHHIETPPLILYRCHW